VSPELLQACAEAFGGRAQVVLDYEAAAMECGGAGEEEVLGLLRRRPCTVADIAGGLGLHPNEVLKHLGRLLRGDLIQSTNISGMVYYSAGRADVAEQSS
jgi:predicted ArsR family transcriptional regulator